MSDRSRTALDLWHFWNRRESDEAQSSTSASSDTQVKVVEDKPLRRGHSSVDTRLTGIGLQPPVIFLSLQTIAPQVIIYTREYQTIECME
jgi:hypothetical protein